VPQLNALLLKFAICKEQMSWKSKNSSPKDKKVPLPCLTSATPFVLNVLTGMARILRGHAVAALENVALWHERDISHSSVERVILPDVCILTHFMLVEITDLVKNLLVYPENMKRNMNLYGGVVFSQRVMLTLVEKGMSREEAYRIVQSCAHEAWNQPEGNFHDLIAQDAAVTSQLTPDEIEQCFDPQHHLKHLDEVYQRLGI
jgi:adenylosuccinate lyase